MARRRSVSVLVRPSRMAIVRLTCSLTSASWVTTTIVTPSSWLTVRRRANTCAEATGGWGRGGLWDGRGGWARGGGHQPRGRGGGRPPPRGAGGEAPPRGGGGTST